MKQYLFLLLIFLASCAAKKEAAIYEAQPSWMKQKPVIQGYYIGVGSAKKVGTSAMYQDKAKRDAMANLAEEISITVSSTSVMHTIETNRGLIETFDQKINVSTDDYLEGFEPVDVYEDELSYWVYYSLKESTYREKKAQKKQEAVNIARSKYMAGETEREYNRPNKAITFYLQGLEAIHDYLTEETNINFKGENMDVGNALYSALNEVLSNMQIQSMTNEITINRGEVLNQTLIFQVYSRKVPVQGIPVKYNFTGSYLNRASDVSDESGFVQLDNIKTNSKKNRELITAMLDFESLASKAVDNLFIRGLIQDYKFEPAKVDVIINARGLALSVAGCQPDQCKSIEKRFRQVAIDAGYVVKNDDQADYIFYVNYKYSGGESAGGLYSVTLNGDLVIQDQNGMEIWAGAIREIKGVAQNNSAARNSAFEEMVYKLGQIYFKQGISYIK